MRYAVISDIHANLEALTAVLADLAAIGIDRIVCLGDLVGYNANPNECIQVIQDRGILCVRGNHDSVAAGLREGTEFCHAAQHAITWTRQHITPANADYLASLPLTRCIDGLFLSVHGSLYPEPNETLRINTQADASLNLQPMAQQPAAPHICFFGHTHHRAAYALQEGQISSVGGNTIHLAPAAFYLINPGSVGQSRDGTPGASFAILDTEQSSITFHRVNYDHHPTLAKARAAKLLPSPHLLRQSARWLKHRVLATLR